MNVQLVDNFNFSLILALSYYLYTAYYLYKIAILKNNGHLFQK